MLGTTVNALAIVVGSLIGIFFRGGMKPRYKDIIISVLGLSVAFIGISTALGGLLSGDAEAILYIVSLVIGSIIGETLKIEEKLEAVGDKIQHKIGNKGGNVSQGFVTASLTFCIGTMAILGSIESGIQGIHTTLFTKSVLDGVTSVIFASTLGIGVLFSAVSVFLYQGLLTMLATVVQQYMTEAMMREISIIGGIMIFAIGCNMLEIRRFKVGNMLPAIFMPVIYYLPPVQSFISWVFGIF
ncbi:MAG TPA: DUF554 domain-containing protein [Lachnospiraceae bacterium]|nr:DUF554 domain-containing protein [Lachnospiraceae bacterium]